MALPLLLLHACADGKSCIARSRAGGECASVTLSCTCRVVQEGYFRVPPAYRLAFRELGTALGVQVNPAAQPEWGPRVEELHQLWAPRALARDRDITPVMLAASLAPGVWDRRYEEKLREGGAGPA